METNTNKDEYLNQELLQIDVMSWNKDIQNQQWMQWLGFAISLLVLFLAPLSEQTRWYGFYIVPISYYSAARADYLIHRNGAKKFAMEKYLDFVGNESMQSLGGSRIVLFDLPIFIAMAVGGKLLSPYPILDLSAPSVVYWIMCLLAGVMVWLATLMGKAHEPSYKIAILSQLVPGPGGD